MPVTVDATTNMPDEGGPAALPDRRSEGTPPGGPRVVAYFTNVYPSASDTFIRREIAELRRLGFVVRTYSVRSPAATELIDACIRSEQRDTTYLLSGWGLPALAAAIGRLLRAPQRMGSAFGLAMRTSASGPKARLWQVAYWLEAARLADLLERSGARHLHHHRAEGSASVAMLASEMTGIAYSLTVHALQEPSPASQWGLDAKLARSAFTICISDFCRDQCARFAPPAAWDRLHVVRCGVDESFVDAAPEAIPSEARIVCVGRLAPEKGQLVLLDAMAMLCRDGWSPRLVLVGDGPMRSEIEARLRQLGLQRAVELAGWKSPPEVREEILRARALVLPSLAEGLPVAAMESLALGRPVVATNVGASAELVEPGVTGWLVAAGSADELAQALREVFEAAPSALATLGQHGAARVRQRHESRREVAKLARLLDRSLVAAAAGQRRERG